MKYQDKIATNLTIYSKIGRPSLTICISQDIKTLTHLFIPISIIAEEGGPMKTISSFSHKSANSGFSDKNPYPGWMACKDEML